MNNKKFGISEITKISILGTISVLLMFIKVPLPFAPTFMEMDIAELPALIGGFAMGPLAGFLIVCIKILLNIVINGTKTFYVGELSNLINTHYLFKQNFKFSPEISQVNLQIS